MTKSTQVTALQPTGSPPAKKGRNSRKKLDYGTKFTGSDSGSDSSGSQPATRNTSSGHSTNGQAQPPRDFLTLAASTVSEEQRQRVAQAFAQAANAASKQKVSSSNAPTHVASTVSQEQQQQVAQAFALVSAASKKDSRKTDNRIPQQTNENRSKKQQRNPNSYPLSAASTLSVTPSQSPSQKWAGGAFANVPDPTNVPMPSMLLGMSSAPPSTTPSLGFPTLRPLTPVSQRGLSSPVTTGTPITSDQLLSLLNASGPTTRGPQVNALPTHCGQYPSTAGSITDAAASQALRQLLNF
mmetsp:Transcript_17702/g.29754  ORF Transcript_17702/g.29754 Transcript_17702/m.29754 type:complete len:297 (-) Transcript_17702:726-1616(-)